MKSNWIVSDILCGADFVELATEEKVTRMCVYELQPSGTMLTMIGGTCTYGGMNPIQSRCSLTVRG